jgi:hypothetical protein
MPDINITFTAQTFGDLKEQIALWFLDNALSQDHNPHQSKTMDEIAKILSADVMTRGVVPEKEEQPEAKEPKPKAKQPEAKEPKVEPQQTPSPVTAQELSSFCLALVRKDPNLKPLIKSTILSFGASLIDDLPKESLYDLKLRLEELQ